MKGEKEKQKLSALIWLEQLCESNFYFWGKCTNTFVIPEELLEEAAEQHSSESPFLTLNRFLFSMFHLSFSANRMVVLLQSSSYCICLWNLDFNMFRHTSSVLPWSWKIAVFNLPIKKKTKITCIKVNGQIKLSQLFVTSTNSTDRKRNKANLNFRNSLFSVHIICLLG